MFYVNLSLVNLCATAMATVGRTVLEKLLTVIPAKKSVKVPLPIKFHKLLDTEDSGMIFFVSPFVH